MPTDYKITMDNIAFLMSTPILPDNEFVTYLPFLSLDDDALFEKSKRITGLKIHWTYRSGVFRKVAGVIELKVMLQASCENDVSSHEGLKRELYAYFKKELSKVGYTGTPIEFENVNINGRSWLKYIVPILGVTEYSIKLSSKRFLTVRFAFIDNTGESLPKWQIEANQLMMDLVKSLKIEAPGLN